MRLSAHKSPAARPPGFFVFAAAAMVAAVLNAAAAFAQDVSTVPPAGEPVAAEHGMVVSAHRLAAQVGVDILERGGNAVDAAVAVGYALAVVYPVAGNLGGGGFMTVRFADGRERFLDFRERAPLAARPDMYQDSSGQLIPDLSVDGWLAVGVPGTVKGLEAARSLWGTMSRSDLIAPAIALAAQGFTLTNADTDIVDEADTFHRHPPLAALFLKPDGSPYASGDRLIQPRLAATLRTIARSGETAFYRGPLADAIAAASRSGHGILTKEDLARYRVRELPPVVCNYREYRVISAPPPSSGGVTLCEILHIVEGFPIDRLAFHSEAEVHDLAEAMRLAFADRNNVLGDPAFVKNPVARLLDKNYAAQLRLRIDPLHAGKSQTPSAPPREGNNTTHFSIVDAAGNAVSVTYTLNNQFGAKVVAGGTGIILNDEMDDFTTKPGAPNFFGLVQGKINAVEPGKTPLSSMSPTILARNGRTVMVIGSPGGPRIITTTLEAIVNAVDHDMNVAQAVAAPRIHHQWLPDILFAEPGAIAPDVSAALVRDGYAIKESRPWSLAEGIIVGGPSLEQKSKNPKERLFGAADPRGAAGAAIGY